MIINRVVEFEPERRIAWRHFTANRWRYELAPTADGGTTVTETFDMSRANGVTDAVVSWAKFPERNRAGHHRHSQAAEAGRRGRRRRVIAASQPGTAHRPARFSPGRTSPVS